MATISEALAIGLKHQRAGQWQEAERAYRQVLETNPRQPQANNNLGDLLLKQGKLEEACEHFRRATAAAPDFVQAHYNLGRVFRLLGMLDESVASFERVAAIRPDCFEVRIDLGGLHYANGDLARAADEFRHALEIRPHAAEAHYNLGTVLYGLGQLAAAAAGYRKAVELKPGLSEPHNNLGTVLRDQGRLDEAVQQFLRAIDLDPANGQAYANLAHSKRFSEADLAEIRPAERLLAGESISRESRGEMHFALGKVYDDVGQWETAFGHYQQANRLAEGSYDLQKHVDSVDSLIAGFHGPFPLPEAAPGRSSQLPIFIVGMPRSASTLVEQIVSSHPSVFGGGELLDMGEVAARAYSLLGADPPYRYDLSRLDPTAACGLADQYLRRIRRLGSGAMRVTDKQLTNFFHLGLIALILPHARVIHCRRHPLDVCLSCYFCNFHDQHKFTHDLKTLGGYYREYERLMDHWQRVLPMPIFEVDYQRLVQKQEEVTRELISFCGLDWDPACLRFDGNSRVVRTASNWQVRKPMFSRSVDRWKHYEQFLDPLKMALGWS